MVVTNNKKQFRFEVLLPDKEYATLSYRWLKGSMVLMHTLVPGPGRGKGIGSVLAKHVLEYAREHNLKIIVYCAFVSKFIKAHPEYKELIEVSKS